MTLTNLLSLLLHKAWRELWQLSIAEAGRDQAIASPHQRLQVYTKSLAREITPETSFRKRFTGDHRQLLSSAYSLHLHEPLSLYPTAHTALSVPLPDTCSI